MDKEQEALLDTAAEYGGAMAGSALGAGIGLMITGPAGAVGGAIAGKAVERIFQQVGAEIKDRLLSKSESKKIGSVYEAAKEKIQKNLDAGKSLRGDHFFEDQPHDRSSAEEILEGTLFAAQRESEEKKLPYLANLYANINFDETIDRPMANQLIKIASDITYRQLVILSVIGKYQTGQIESPPLREEAFHGINGYHNISIASEVFDLYRRSLLFSRNTILDAAGFTPSLLEIGGIGTLFYKYMELSEMASSDVEKTIIAFLTEEPCQESAEQIQKSTLPLEESTIETYMSNHTATDEEVAKMLDEVFDKKRPDDASVFTGKEVPKDLKEGDLFLKILD